MDRNRWQGGKKQLGDFYISVFRNCGYLNPKM